MAVRGPAHVSGEGLRPNHSTGPCHIAAATDVCKPGALAGCSHHSFTGPEICTLLYVTFMHL